jgi:uncharacterized protein (DUF1501 family)
MRIWQAGRRENADREAYGWLGRTLDQSTRSNPASVESDAVYVGAEETPFALWGRRASATSLSEAGDLTLDRATPPLGEADDKATGIASFVTQQSQSAFAAAEAFARDQRAASASRSAYPTSELGSRLGLVARLLRSGSPARVYYASQSGYDTHSEQLFPHANLLREFSDALQAFLDDLRTDQLDRRVVVLAFSEFGRRVAENDSKGTDHGAAGPVFVAGTPIKAGLYGDRGDLSRLVDGDVPMQVDFRRLYATLLDRWIGVPSEVVLGTRFEPLPFL